MSGWQDLAAPWLRPFMDTTTFSQSVALIYRPLVWLSFTLDYALWGLDPLGFHLTNLVLFLACLGALFGLLRALGVQTVPVVATCAIYALHPAFVQIVPGLARRHDLVPRRP
jgi:hypothetical protein